MGKLTVGSNPTLSAANVLVWRVRPARRAVAVPAARVGRSVVQRQNKARCGRLLLVEAPHCGAELRNGVVRHRFSLSVTGPRDNCWANACVTMSAMATGYEAVLFDFGGVLTTSPFEAMRAKGETSGAGYDLVRTLVMVPYDEDTDHPWHRCERGHLALPEALALITAEAAAAGLDFDPSKIGSFFGPAAIQDIVVAKIRTLRSGGYRTALVTNNVRELGPFWRPLVPLDELFDLVVDSSEIGVRKPDPRIFTFTLERLGVTPERAVFVDDWPGHVAAARGVGLHGIVMGSDAQAALDELDAVLAGRRPGGPSDAQTRNRLR